MASFFNKVRAADRVVGVSQPFRRVAAVIGEDPPVPSASPQALVSPKSRPASLTEFLSQVRAAQEALDFRDVKNGPSTVIGAVAGGLLWRDHRVLGVIGGASLGRNIPALLDERDRKWALCNLSSTGAGVAGSLLWKEHPVWGFMLPFVLVSVFAGNVTAYFARLRRE